VRAGLDGAFRHAQDSGHLVQVASAQVDLLDHGPVLRGERVERGVHGDRRDHGPGVVLDRSGVGRRLGDLPGAHGPRPGPADHDVAHRGEQPTPDRALAVGQHLGVPPDPDQGLLNDVLGQFAVTEQSGGIKLHCPAVLGKNRPRHLLIAASGHDDKGPESIEPDMSVPGFGGQHPSGVYGGGVVLRGRLRKSVDNGL
jgi:hypothetical protein